MRIPTSVCRLGYRGAYLVLRVYWFLRRPDVVGVKCVLTDGDRILLVRHAYGRTKWDLPGGTVRRGEEPSRAATREMREELGVTVDRWDPLGQLYAVIDFHKDTMHCFRAEVRQPQISLARCELTDFGWFERRALPADAGRFVGPILDRLPA